MTLITARRIPRTRCAHDGGPFLSRTTYCPMHTTTKETPE